MLELTLEELKELVKRMEEIGDCHVEIVVSVYSDVDELCVEVCRNNSSSSWIETFKEI